MSAGSPLLGGVGFELLEPPLAEDIEAALSSAIAANVVFRSGASPVRVFQELLGEAIRDVEHHPRGELFQRFLTRGPYWAPGSVVNIKPIERNRFAVEGVEPDRWAVRVASARASA